MTKTVPIWTSLFVMANVFFTGLMYSSSMHSKGIREGIENGYKQGRTSAFRSITDAPCQEPVYRFIDRDNNGKYDYFLMTGRDGKVYTEPILKEITKEEILRNAIPTSGNIEFY